MKIILFFTDFTLKNYISHILEILLVLILKLKPFEKNSCLTENKSYF